MHPSSEPSRRTRRVFALLAACAVVGAGIGSGASAAVAAEPEPALHYTMDDIAEEIVPDSSPNGWDGTISGSVEQTASPDGTALGLTGGHVTLPPQILDGAVDASISVRVRWLGTGGAWQWLYGLGVDNQRYIFTSPAGGDGTLRTAITRASGGSAEQIVSAAAALPSGSWVTLTTTLDTSTDRLTSYLDGVEVGSVATDITADELIPTGSSIGGYIGKSFYPDPAFIGEIDDFRLYHAALTPQQVAELAGGEVPTIESLSTSSFAVETRAGVAPALPESVSASYSDGFDRQVPISWSAVAPEQYSTAGSFTVSGTAGDVAVVANVSVARGELTIDFGEETGDYLGGASGFLYGLYGDGMPTDNLVEGIDVRSVATKAQDGAQHPGSDALEILPTLAKAGGDVYLRITDWYRGFPYQWPGSTPEEKLASYNEVLDAQLAMIADVPAEQRAHLGIEPFNEPEGNMFGTGQWSLDGTSWLDDPADYFAAWDSAHRKIKAAFPDLRVAGPGTEYLNERVPEFLEHAVAEGTVPDIVTWHELSHPQRLRESVERYRAFEIDVFGGTAYEGRELPINVNEYAWNFHTSVPGQMIQWISAIEDAKVDAMVAFWNVNGNLSDSAVQQNRGNGQWWLFNSYAQMSGRTVAVTPPNPGESYTLQGVATIDPDRKLARAIIGGADGAAPIDLADLPADVFGDNARIQVREIGWSGQIGDSASPTLLDERIVSLADGLVPLVFDGTSLPLLDASSAYEIVITPAGSAPVTEAATPWKASYEAEAATSRGAPYVVEGPQGSPTNAGGYFTSGGRDVAGFQTGSSLALDFAVEVPADGVYDLSLFSSSLNTAASVAENGPTNVFVSIDGAAEQELLLPLSYRWLVWDHSETQVELAAGAHTITVSSQSLDGTRSTKGEAVLDRVTLTTAAAPDHEVVYEAELSDHDGAVRFDDGGVVELTDAQSATFWVYGEADAEATLRVLGEGSGVVALNGESAFSLAEGTDAAVRLQGGVNKIVVDGPATIDALRVGASAQALPATVYQAEEAELRGSAAVIDLSNAEAGQAVDAIGGAPGNESTLTFEVDATHAGPHAVVVRFSNPEQVPATHYNPNPMARHADIAVNGQAPHSVLFVPTFHRNNFWERTVVVELIEGRNTLTFSAQEQKNFDGTTYAAENWPDIPLRSDQAPIIDRITVVGLASVLKGTDPEPTVEPTAEPTPGTTGEPTATAPGMSTSPPDSEDLTEALRNAVTGPATIARGERIAVTVGETLAGQSVFGWLLSTPTSLGSGAVTASGTVLLVVPQDAPLGQHRLAVTDSDGAVVGWYPVTVVERGLASTGFSANVWLIGALLAICIGSVIRYERSRRMRRLRRAVV